MPKAIEMVGQRYGRWYVIEEVERLKMRSTTARQYRARCDCGTIALVQGSNLRHGYSTSCGCFRRENAAKMHRTHGDTVQRSPTAEYRTWVNMLRRCANPDSSGYERYGGRGIRVCRRWKSSFPNFLADMGRRPSTDHSVDRRNGDGHYEPSNCRWATRREQRRNQSRTRLILRSGEALPLSEWAERQKLSSRAVAKRLRRGWTIDEALDWAPRKRWQGSGRYLRTKPPADASKCGA